MDLSFVPTDVSDLPDDLVAAVTAEAERDAEATAIFLDRLFLAWSRHHPEHGPPETYRGLYSSSILLELGAALRIMRWERARLLRPWMELPDSQQALRMTLLGVSEHPRSTPLFHRVLQIFVEHFSWLAAKEMRGDLLIEPDDEDWLADRLAEFLWNNRHQMEDKTNE